MRWFWFYSLQSQSAGNRGWQREEHRVIRRNRGIALAAEWAGIETVAFCEREPFCQKVLNKNFPGVPIFDDVRTLNRQLLEDKGVIEPDGTIDIISGDSLASLTVLPGSEEARKMTATSGRKCLGSSKNLDPLGLLVKTLLTSQTWSSTARYLTWKVRVTKAIVYYTGCCRRRPTSKRPSLCCGPSQCMGREKRSFIEKESRIRQTSDKSYNCNQLYPTPLASDATNGTI